MNATTRSTELRQMLITRQFELEGDVRNRIRDGRTDRPNDVRDDVEASECHTQGDIEFAVLQMRTETLMRIREALIRLDAGKYGSCFACGSEIAERRLRALPFAVRCQACEEQREIEQNRARHVAQARSGFSLFPDAVGF